MDTVMHSGFPMQLEYIFGMGGAALTPGSVEILPYQFNCQRTTCESNKCDSVCQQGVKKF